MQIFLLASTLSGVISRFFGGFDTLLKAIITFVILDYLTGVMQAIANKKLSSSIGFKGIFKKVLIFFIIGIAVTLDNILGTNNLRYIVIIFYIVNEGISIIENAAKMGLPIPKKIKDTLEKFNEEKGDT